MKVCAPPPIDIYTPPSPFVIVAPPEQTEGWIVDEQGERLTHDPGRHVPVLCACGGDPLLCERCNTRRPCQCGGYLILNHPDARHSREGCYGPVAKGSWAGAFVNIFDGFMTVTSPATRASTT